ncbi:hypothetical protein ACI68E_000934 [Malassezia pachydermatis]
MNPVHIIEQPYKTVVRSGPHEDPSIQDKEINGKNDTHIVTEPLGVESNVLEKAPKDTIPKNPQPQPFSHHFLDPELKHIRKAYLIPVGVTTIIVMCMVWLFCSIHWAALYKMNDHTPRIHALVVNRDNGIIGTTITKALLDSNHGPVPHSTWFEGNVTDFPTQDSIVKAVEPNHDYWLAVEIRENLTQELEQARMTGDSSWDPHSALTMIFATGRNVAATSPMIVTPAQRLIESVEKELSANLTSQFLAENAGNAEVIQGMITAPQLLSNPLDMRMMDVRPWIANTALAPTFDGMIYLIILPFQVVMAEYDGRRALHKYLHLKGQIFLRIGAALIWSIFISLMITLINIPFELPFDGAFSYGGGFMIYWLSAYCGIVVFSLALESVLTLMTPTFIGVFLLLLIISNLSIANFPVELEPSFYKYGYAMPFYNLRQIYLSVMLDVGDSTLILKHIGIIWAWVALILLTFPFVIWYDYRKQFKAYHKSILFGGMD